MRDALEGFGKAIAAVVIGVVAYILLWVFLPSTWVMVVFIGVALSLAAAKALAATKSGLHWDTPTKRSVGTLGLVFPIAVFVTLFPFLGWSAPLHSGWVVFVILLCIPLLLVTAIRLFMVELPDTAVGDEVGVRIWGEPSDPTDPNSGPRFAPIQYAQWGVTGLFVLLMVLFWIFGGSAEHQPQQQAVASTPSSSAPASSTGRPPTTSQTTSTAPAMPPSAGSTTSTTTATSAAPAAADTSCEGASILVQAAVTPENLQPKLPVYNDGKVSVCVSGAWQSPKTYDKTMMTVAKMARDQNNQYYQGTIQGTTVVLRGPLPS